MFGRPLAWATPTSTRGESKKYGMQRTIPRFKGWWRIIRVPLLCMPAGLCGFLHPSPETSSSGASLKRLEWTTTTVPWEDLPQGIDPEEDILAGLDDPGKSRTEVREEKANKNGIYAQVANRNRLLKEKWDFLDGMLADDETECKKYMGYRP